MTNSELEDHLFHMDHADRVARLHDVAKFILNRALELCLLNEVDRIDEVIACVDCGVIDNDIFNLFYNSGERSSILITVAIHLSHNINHVVSSNSSGTKDHCWSWASLGLSAMIAVSANEQEARHRYMSLLGVV